MMVKIHPTEVRFSDRKASSAQKTKSHTKENTALRNVTQHNLRTPLRGNGRCFTYREMGKWHLIQTTSFPGPFPWLGGGESPATENNLLGAHPPPLQHTPHPSSDLI